MPPRLVCRPPVRPLQVISSKAPPGFLYVKLFNFAVDVPPAVPFDAYMENKFDLSLNARSAGRAGRMNVAGIVETAVAVKGTPAAVDFAAAVAVVIQNETAAVAAAQSRFNRLNNRAAAAAFNAAMRRLSVAEYAAKLAAA